MRPASHRRSLASHLTKVCPEVVQEPQNVKLIVVIDRETLRKRYVASLENRTPDQMKEEEALFVELKRLEQNERRFKRDRDELLRTLAGMESGLPDINADEEAFSANSPMEFKKSKKKGGNNTELDTPISASASTSTIALSAPPPKKQSAKTAAYGKAS